MSYLDDEIKRLTNKYMVDLLQPFFEEHEKDGIKAITEPMEILDKLTQQSTEKKIIPFAIDDQKIYFIFYGNPDLIIYSLNLNTDPSENQILHEIERINTPPKTCYLKT